MEKSLIDPVASMTGLVYLATPYSHPDEQVQEFRFNEACRIAGHFMQRSVCIFSPIAHTHAIACQSNLPKGWEFWQRYDHEMIIRSSSMLVACIDGWKESKGVQAEIKFARHRGLMIRYCDDVCRLIPEPPL